MRFCDRVKCDIAFMHCHVVLHYTIYNYTCIFGVILCFTFIRQCVRHNVRTAVLQQRSVRTAAADTMSTQISLAPVSHFENSSKVTR